MGKDEKYPWEICIKVSTDGIHRTSKVATSVVAVPHVDRTVGQIIHGPSIGVCGKQVYVKTNGNGEYLGEA